MPTHAELTSKLLRDAATFFRTLAQHNEPLRKQMNDNAGVFEQIATYMDNDPVGSIDGSTVAGLSARLLKDAALFFRTLAEQNEPIREQMNENANIYDQLADLVESNPMGILE